MNDSVNPNRIGDDAVASMRMTTQSTRPSPSLAPKTAQRTSLGHRLQRALTGGPNRRFPGLPSPPGGTASPSLLLNRRLAFPILALLALLTASLLFLLPGGPLHAQDADGPIMYAENGTGPVATYTAVDPEGDAIRWSLTGADAEDFSITGGVLRFNSTPNYEAAADVDMDNTYNIMVIATDSGELAAMRAVTVTVTDVDEAGTLTLSTLQPVDGILLTTTLTDIDGVVSADMWKWAKSTTAAGVYTDIEGAKLSSYTPKPADVNHYLRATATYTDPQGSGKMKMVVSAYKVLVTRSTNTAPVFKDADGMEIATDTAITREVVENTPKGVSVGAPVVATDSEGDVLTYTLTLGETEAGSFSIDVATGQLKTSAALNFEVTPTYMVMVTATDPSFTEAAGSDTITVTISVTNVDEDPKIATGPASARVAENTAIDVTVATYTATDDEDDVANAAVVLTKSGPDQALFSLNAQGVLTFSAMPNFEAPKDAGRNNVYNITVVATDSDGQTDEMDVIVTVANVEEDGTVTLSPLQPRIGSPVTATLSDIDGAVSDVKWKWAKSVPESGDPYEDIEGATAASYTPVMADNAMFLRATATYTDPEGSDTAMSDPTETGFLMVEIDDTNRAPEFPDQDDKMDGDQTDQEREIAENTAAGLPIGGADGEVAATDSNMDDLTYSLGGTDGASFSIVRNTGQLQTKAALNREEKATHMVTVTATDPSGLSATVNVTIEVTNVDEDPTLTGPASPRVAENTATAVATYVAMDDEDDKTGTAIRWTLGGTNASDFSITGGVLRFKSAPNYEPEANSTYNIMVIATDSDGDADEMEVTVTVTNVDEAGTLTLSTLQPVDGIQLTTTLTDIDGDTEDVTWKWAKSSSKTGTYTVIEGAAVATYTPKPVDVRHYLRVTATYTDPQGSGKIAVATTANKVLVGRSTNTTPVFKDADGMEIATDTAITREVVENTPKGVSVGAPVAATDSEGDVLTYTLTLGGTEAGSFSIDVATGQLKTSAALNFEVTPTYMVMVTATDPSFTEAAGSDTIMVTINVTNVDEDPKLTGPASVRVSEETTTPMTPSTYEPTTPTYTATDDEDRVASAEVVLTKSGPDQALFSLNAQGVLTFSAMPNFEAPKDAGRNNVYNITVVATDSDGQTDEMDVIVTVANVEEDGTVTLSPLQPRIGSPVTATLSDIDGAVSDVKWKWAKSVPESGDPYEDIEGATAASYTPVMADNAMFLRATATYTDPEGSDTAMSDPTETGFMMVEMDDTNRAPEFPDQDDKMDGDQTDQEREIPENTEAPQPIGAVVTATDPNTDSLTYSLGGTDGASFSIVRNTGQLQTKAALNREEKATHMVTVTATDPSGLSATVNVTIKITDVPEPPVIMRAPDANVAPEFASATTSRTVAENTAAGENIGNPVAASDANGDTLTYALSGTDAASFDIDTATGQLMTLAALDSETKASYSVTVTASDSGGLSDSIDVTVTVTNVNEAPVAPTVANQTATKDTAFSYTVPAFTDPEGGTITYTATLSDDSALPGWLSFNASTRELSGTPLEADTPASLTIEVSATDDGSPSASAQVTFTLTVGEEAPTTLLVRYDDSKDGWIQLREARVAVGDYFGPPKGVKLSLADTRKVVGLYFEYKNSQ